MSNTEKLYLQEEAEATGEDPCHPSAYNRRRSIAAFISSVFLNILTNPMQNKWSYYIWDGKQVIDLVLGLSQFHHILCPIHSQNAVSWKLYYRMTADMIIIAPARIQTSDNPIIKVLEMNFTFI